jgi:predicted transcriptional regulator of viral defense system
MARKETYRRRLYERARDQYGYVTTSDAEELGIPPVELRKLRQRGGLEHIGQGLYRFEDIPRTPRDQFMEAVLRVGPEAVLAGDAVLALHDLALVNPKRIRVATPRRVRRRLPPFLNVEHRPTPEPQRTQYEGIPSTTVAQALRDCRGQVMTERLIDATREAARAGLVSKGDAGRLLEELGTAR